MSWSLLVEEKGKRYQGRRRVEHLSGCAQNEENRRWAGKTANQEIENTDPSVDVDTRIKSMRRKLKIARSQFFKKFQG